MDKEVECRRVAGGGGIDDGMHNFTKPLIGVVKEESNSGTGVEEAEEEEAGCIGQVRPEEGVEEDGVGARREAEGASVGGEGEETERRLRADEG